MKTAALFSDHMVLQNGVRIPVWGWSEPGDEIVVRFIPGAGSGDKEQEKTARAGADGKWTVHLDALRTSAQPARIAIRSKKDGASQEIQDVLVGEVWLASGQSNMQWVVRDSLKAPEEMAAADWPAVRMFSVPQLIHMSPPKDVKASWAVCGPKTVGDFSAVAYFFGREIHQCLGVPVGLVNSSWGGTRVEPWISRDVLMTEELCAQEVRGFETVLRSLSSVERKAQMDTYLSDPNRWLREHVAPDPGNEGFGRGWAEPGFDDSAWAAMDLPMAWQRAGVYSNGVVWFRRQVDVPREWAGRDLVLKIGCCDKHDVTYFNNVEVGKTSWETDAPWNVRRSYRVPGRLVQAGRNTIAVRVYSYRNAGGMLGPADDMRLESSNGEGGPVVALAGSWQYQMEHDFGVIKGTAGQPEPLPNQNSPYALFDNMIAPLVPYAVRGTIWYQGESNTDQPHLYRTRFSMMIRNWRELWGNDEMPFLFVQLANFLPAVPPGSKSGLPALREAQLQTLSEKNTAMAVTVDIGDPVDIHPKNKQDVGRRLALAAEALVYGRKVVPSGPLYRSHRVEGDAIRVRFDHVGGGLEAKGGGRLKGFAVAGEGRTFADAEATIEGDTVRVRADGVERPIAVRYAWANNPDGNLYNREGLPASPFRTDQWR